MAPPTAVHVCCGTAEQRVREIEKRDCPSMRTFDHIHGRACLSHHSRERRSSRTHRVHPGGARRRWVGHLPPLDGLDGMRRAGRLRLRIVYIETRHTA